MNINLNEIYASFDGEVNCFGQGTPSVFIRFQGCNLNCIWCDTKYAQEHDQKAGHLFTVDHLVEEVKTQFPGFNKVTITGGEPMLQPNALRALTKRLFFEGYRISVETNGSKPWGSIENGEFRVHCWVVDYKLKGSQQTIHMHPFRYYNEVLTSDDFVKFVIFLPNDFDEAVTIQKKLEDMGCEARFAYSTTTHYVSHQKLAEDMLKSPEILSRAVFNPQIHKLIWPHQRRR